MTTQNKIRRQWQAMALNIYDLMDETGRRELFANTCWAASGRWTVKELDAVSTILEMNIKAR